VSLSDAEMVVARQIGCGYLSGLVAVDVSRLTGLPLAQIGSRLDEGAEIHPFAVTHPERMFLDLTRMAWWDRWRVAWALIGAHYYLDANERIEGCHRELSLPSDSCSGSSR
jgi:hypothetical protein